MGSTPREAFEAVFRNTHASVRRYVERRVPNREIAEDVVSETYLAAWSQGEAPAELPWLYRVASNKIADHYRASERQRLLQESLEQTAVTTTDPEQMLESIALKDALMTLKLREREAIMLTYWEGLGAAEVAVVLSCSETSAWAVLSRARKKLRAVMGTRHNALQTQMGLRT